MSVVLAISRPVVVTTPRVLILRIWFHKKFGEGRSEIDLRRKITIAWNWRLRTNMTEIGPAGNRSLATYAVACYFFPNTSFPSCFFLSCYFFSCFYLSCYFFSCFFFFRFFVTFFPVTFFLFLFFPFLFFLLLSFLQSYFQSNLWNSFDDLAPADLTSHERPIFRKSSRELKIKMSYHFRDPYDKDKMVSRPSCL